MDGLTATPSSLVSPSSSPPPALSLSRASLHRCAAVPLPPPPPPRSTIPPGHHGGRRACLCLAPVSAAVPGRPVGHCRRCAEKALGTAARPVPPRRALPRARTRPRARALLRDSAAHAAALHAAAGPAWQSPLCRTGARPGDRARGCAPVPRVVSRAQGPRQLSRPGPGCGCCRAAPPPGDPARRSHAQRSARRVADDYRAQVLDN